MTTLHRAAIILFCLVLGLGALYASRRSNEIVREHYEYLKPLNRPFADFWGALLRIPEGEREERYIRLSIRIHRISCLIAALIALIGIIQITVGR